jgi:hypothetical protein
MKRYLFLLCFFLCTQTFLTAGTGQDPENLKMAVDHGFDDIEHIKQDEDLASLRDDEGFQKVIKR